MKPLIECVPNFSEGRSTETIESIRKCIQDCQGISLWDYSADPDHNRSVFTLAGSPNDMEECVSRFVKTANAFIDMSAHEGAHPCIGAADVIPFVPLRGTSMEDCINLARKTANRISEENRMPVYLYAKSARTPAHIRLADIRRGGYPTLKEEIKTDPNRKPDFGPCELPPYGGASVGARNFLIAFNIYLSTKDVRPAKRIASAIRESSGGISGLQAIGLFVNGSAQVSMNIVDHHKAPLSLIFDRVQSLAEEKGLSISHSELIGLLPQAALENTSPEKLLLKNFSPDRIIENRLKQLL